MFSSVFENVSLKISLEPRQHIAYPGVGKCPGENNARGIGDHIEDFKITGRRHSLQKLNTDSHGDKAYDKYQSRQIMAIDLCEPTH